MTQESRRNLKCETPSTLGDGGSQLPEYDQGLCIRVLVLLGLGFSSILALVLLGGGLYTLSLKSNGFNISLQPLGLDIALYFAPLLATIVTALSETSTGYAHSVGLVWCLWHEDRLDYNTNTKLLTGSCNCWPSSRTSNLFYIFALALGYAASSNIVSPDPEGLVVNGPALILLAGSWIIQITLSIASLYLARKRIKSWNLDALNIALIRHSSDLNSMKGRCLLPAADFSSSRLKNNKPKLRQPTMYQTARFVKIHLVLVWITLLIVSLEATVLTLGRKAFVRQDLEYSVTSDFLSSFSFLISIFLGTPDASISPEFAGILINCPTFLESSIVGTLIYAMFQWIVTLGTYSAQVIISVAEDEKRWRRATASAGTPISASPFKSILRSWKSIFLFFYKILSNYYFGKCISVSRTGNSSIELGLAWPCFWLFAVFFLILSVLVTVIAKRRPRGPQPSTWGHHQTIINLIDDWGQNGKRLFWGDKGVVWEASRTRHAGTANYPLGKINLEANYW